MNKRSFKSLLILTNVLNLADCLLTTYWIQTNQAYELNPLLRELTDNPILFFLIKVGMVLAGTFLLFKCINSKFAQVSTIILTMIYLSIVGYHVWYIL